PGDAPLPPVELLDGFGRLQKAPPSVRPIAGAAFTKTVASAAHPPGYYGTEDARQALNLAGAIHDFAAIGSLPPGVARDSYARGAETDLRPPLLASALILALIDLVIAYALRGLFAGLHLRRRHGAAVGALVAAILLLGAGNAVAASQADDDFALQ